MPRCQLTTTARRTALAVRRARAGMTLLEILLVLGILVIIASLATPSLVRMLESQKLRKSADVLRSEFARARITAMKKGRIQMFRYQVEQGGYASAEWYAADDELEASDVPEMLLALEPKQLPDGIVFLGGEALSDVRSLAIDQALALELSRERVWSPPILFYPDGSSSDAVVVLANARNQVIQVSLRGITGLSQTSELTRLEELLP